MPKLISCSTQLPGISGYVGVRDFPPTTNSAVRSLSHQSKETEMKVKSQLRAGYEEDEEEIEIEPDP